MSGKKVYIVLAIAAVLVVSGVTAWFYFLDDLPKKVPVRSRQVWLYDTFANRGGLMEPFDTYNISLEAHTIVAQA